MGLVEGAVSSPQQPTPLPGSDRQTLPERIGKQLQVSRAEAIFKMKFKHE